MSVFSRLTLLVFLLLCSCATPEPDEVETRLPSAPRVPFPARAASALSGSQVAQKIGKLNESEREEAIVEQYRLGNLPDFLRHFTPVRYKAKLRSGAQAEVQIWVLPDYLAIGSNADFVRTPMSPISAQIIAEQYGLFLPTVKIVDAIYGAAGVKLDPQPFKPGPQMVTVAEFVRHNQAVQDKLKGRGSSSLVAGHKKDIVLSNALLKKPNRVAIYGWHLRSGTAIQPLTTVHGNWYADYSHGTRLLAPTVLINGKSYRLSEALQSPEFAPLLSYEGPLRVQRYPNTPVRKRWWPQS